ncbi:MAG: hypothetical protein R3A10_10535 [Caldilineaceae bacterium]
MGDRLACVFVDHGLLRKDEATQVIDTFRTHQGMHLVAVDAKEEFLTDLAGITGSRGEAQTHRRALHPRLRERRRRGWPDVGRGLARFCPGHALSRCHRVGRQ